LEGVQEESTNWETFVLSKVQRNSTS